MSHLESAVGMAIASALFRIILACVVGGMVFGGVLVWVLS